jgi:hypothetical protein
MVESYGENRVNTAAAEWIRSIRKRNQLGTKREQVNLAMTYFQV